MARGDTSGGVDTVEAALQEAVADLTEVGPPRLREAIHHAVFPGGARLRPRLCVAVARACGESPRSARVLGPAIAVELFHCASLVHDDLPCFDDAPTRRGRPSVHAAFGEALAVLAGDALIVGGFETAARALAPSPAVLARLVAVLGRGLGASRGIIAGQAWESEPQVEVSAYHRAKTGALFEAAAAAGALVAGGDPEAFRPLGALFGEAYQLLDDIADATQSAARIGKPTGRDAALCRPNAVAREGLDEAMRRADDLVRRAQLAVPRGCSHPELLARWVETTVQEALTRLGVASVRTPSSA